MPSLFSLSLIQPWSFTILNVFGACLKTKDHCSLLTSFSPHSVPVSFPGSRFCGSLGLWCCRNTSLRMWTLAWGVTTSNPCQSTLTHSFFFSSFYLEQVSEPGEGTECNLRDKLLHIDGGQDGENRRHRRRERVWLLLAFTNSMMNGRNGFSKTMKQL